MKVLITGSEGFVGREFQRQLDGHNITRVDLKINGDCREFFQFTDTQYDLVVHLAAIVGGRKTIEGNPLAIADDLSIDAEMFNWAIRTNQKSVMYFSSSAAYPIGLQTLDAQHKLSELDIDLDNIHNPDLTYGWAKLTGEYLAKFANEAGVFTHVFRPFSGYGGDQDLDYPFPTFIQRGLRRDDPFDVWGHGNQVRDFIHIEDVVAGAMSAYHLGYPLPVNLGTGRPTSFNELAGLVASEIGYSPEIANIPGPVGVEYRVSDNELCDTIRKPKITLEEGIARAIREAGQ